MRTYTEIKEYINHLEVVDKETVYYIESAITDRKSMIINDLEIVDGRLDYESKLRNGSKYMKQMIREIQSLEKAKVTVVEMMRGENDGN